MDAVLKPTIDDFHAAPQRGPRVVSSTGARNLERGRGSLSLSDPPPDRRPPVSFVVEFPGGPSCPPPCPPRLVGAAAAAAARRNAGTMPSVMDADANRHYSSPPPRPKLRSTAAADAAARNRGATTAFCLDHDRNRGYSSARGPCVRGDVARATVERSRGVMSGVMAGEGNADHEPARPASRLMGTAAQSYAQRDRATTLNDGPYQFDRLVSRAGTAEARDNASRGTGQAVSRLIGGDDRGPSPRPGPRVKSDAARDMAARSRAGTCGLALEGRLSGDPVHEARVKGSGKDNCERGRQGSVSSLLSDKGREPVAERPASRVRDAGAEISQTGQTGSVHRLFHSYGQMPRSPRPAARVSSDARPNAIRNMGTMSDFL